MAEQTSQTVTPPAPGPGPAPDPTQTGFPPPAGADSQRPRRQGRAQRPPTGVPENNEEPDGQETIWQFMQGLEEADWSQYMAYLYRWEPYTDQTRGGIQPKYVKLYNSAFTIDTVKHDCGSGKYQIKLNLYNPTLKKDRTVKEHVFEIMDPEFPPNVPEDAWVADPRNNKWRWARKQPGAAGAGTAANPWQIPNDPLAFAKFIRDTVQSTYPSLQNSQKDAITSQVVSILPALLKQSNEGPSSLIGVLKDARELLTPPPPPQDTSTQSFITMMIGRLDSMEKQNAAMQMKIFELLEKRQETARQPTLLEQAKTFGEAFSAISEGMNAFGARGGSNMSGWQEVVSNVATQLTQSLAPAIPAMMAAGMRQPPPRTVVMPPPGVPGATPGGVPGGVPQSPATPGPGPSTAGGAQLPDQPFVEPTEQEANMDFFASILRQYAPPIVAHFNAGVSGIDFAWWIIDGFGPMPLNILKGQGKDAILATIQTSIPELNAQLAPNWQQFGDFVDECLSWNPQMGREQEDEPTPGPGPVAVAPPTPPPVKPITKTPATAAKTKKGATK